MKFELDLMDARREEREESKQKFFKFLARQMSEPS